MRSDPSRRDQLVLYTVSSRRGKIKVPSSPEKRKVPSGPSKRKSTVPSRREKRNLVQPSKNMYRPDPSSGKKKCHPVPSRFFNTVPSRHKKERHCRALLYGTGSVPSRRDFLHPTLRPIHRNIYFHPFIVPSHPVDSFFR